MMDSADTTRLIAWLTVAEGPPPDRKERIKLDTVSLRSVIRYGASPLLITSSVVIANPPNSRTRYFGPLAVPVVSPKLITGITSFSVWRKVRDCIESYRAE